MLRLAILLSASKSPARSVVRTPADTSNKNTFVPPATSGTVPLSVDDIKQKYPSLVEQVLQFSIKSKVEKVQRAKQAAIEASTDCVPTPTKAVTNKPVTPPPEKVTVEQIPVPTKHEEPIAVAIPASTPRIVEQPLPPEVPRVEKVDALTSPISTPRKQSNMVEVQTDVTQHEDKFADMLNTALPPRIEKISVRKFF